MSNASPTDNVALPDERLERIRRLHFRNGEGRCAECASTFPCTTTRVIDPPASIWEQIGARPVVDAMSLVSEAAARDPEPSVLRSNLVRTAAAQITGREPTLEELGRARVLFNTWTRSGVLIIGPGGAEEDA